MNNYSYKLCDPKANSQDALNILHAIKDELHLPDHSQRQWVVNLCLKKGGIVLGYDNSTACALSGFLHGDPNDNYHDKSIGLLVVSAALRTHRQSHLLYDTLRYSLQILKKRNVRYIFLQAEKDCLYINRLYNRLAEPIFEEYSLSGVPIITYSNHIDRALASFGCEQANSWPQRTVCSR